MPLTRVNESVPVRGRRSLSPGSVLHRAGEPAGAVHLVERGALKFVDRDEDGRETIVGIALPGDCAGDVAATDGGPQPFDAVAVLPSTVAVLDPSAGTSLVAASLARRARRLAAMVHERSAANAGARVAACLLDLADRGQLRIPLPQEDLGRLAGASRETVCKELKRLRAAGAVAYRGRTLRILRPDLLERLRCGELRLPAAPGGGLSRSASAGVARRSRSIRDI
ncbi:MAG TPA: Crp/Fnr family transcriptional regulator [Actinomycetota bacterium]|nr:Crp/Fnr family transcriptional regulator [Actinomycetota bacterium]